MKFPFAKLATAILLAAATLGGSHAVAADAQSEMKELMPKIKAKIDAGKKSAADFADELKALDAIFEAHKAETATAAEILMIKSGLHGQFFHNPAKASELLQQLVKEFPGTPQAQKAAELIPMLATQIESAKLQDSLVVGAAFPDFAVTDLDGKPLSLGQFKGKVVLIDFWATWCGPCVRELPNVLKAYEKFHDKGLEVVGISLDKDEAALRKFLKEKNMPWPQYFDGKGWQNKLATQYGVQGIPLTFLLDKEGKILAKNLRGPELEKAIERAFAPQ